MANTPYVNKVATAKFDNYFNSRLDLMARFTTVDTELTLRPGMTRTVITYDATSGAENTEVVARGKGNTKDITAAANPQDYEIIVLQNRFEILDEDYKEDPKLLEALLKAQAASMHNKTNALVIAEMYKSTNLLTGTGAYTYDNVVDALANLELEDTDEVRPFLLVHPKDAPGIRKALKDSLQYVSEFARRGYIGSFSNCDVFFSNEVVEKKAVLGLPDAVTTFVAVKGEVEEERDADLRKNRYFARKYLLPALSNMGRCVILDHTGAAAANTEGESNTEGE